MLFQYEFHAQGAFGVDVPRGDDFKADIILHFRYVVKRVEEFRRVYRADVAGDGVAEDAAAYGVLVERFKGLEYGFLYFLTRCVGSFEATASPSTALPSATRRRSHRPGSRVTRSLT